MVTSPLQIAEGVGLWREKYCPALQRRLLEEIRHKLQQAPLYRPVMPKTGTAFSVEESNFGRLGWVSDKGGYRYQASHPQTGAPWPGIPQILLSLWAEINGAPPPDCCLVNFYRANAKLGLHQDRDEKDVSAAVVAVSLGDEAVFRIGGCLRGAKTQRLTLHSGDVLAFGGRARLAYHGIDRIRPGTSRLIEGGGRLSLTLRKVAI